MRLVERDTFLAQLQKQLHHAKHQEGHCVLVSGEAGIGKSSLVKVFCDDNRDSCTVLTGLCDALFTPRPLAPLYDVADQLALDLTMYGDKNRSVLFTTFMQQLTHIIGTTILVFEDVHWADEATFDFIKFLARRITRTKCLFILTYRDDEVHTSHPIATLPGQMAASTFTRLQLTPLSKPAVDGMAAEKGFKGNEVYAITGGNPFYVNEILAGYSPGVPDNVKDAIIAVYNRQQQATRNVWNILSLTPSGFEIEYLEIVEPCYADAIEQSLETKILLITDGRIHFKHELYRRAIEANLSPLAQITLNRKILQFLLSQFSINRQEERIMHHAQNANASDLIVEYGPAAAKKAASVGSHAEACKLYRTVIDHYKGQDAGTMIQFYSAYAYECYLTSNIKEAIVYQEKILHIFQAQNAIVQAGDCMRFLSRLNWYDGNRKNAEHWGIKAVDVLANQPASTEKAMALSNMAQLKMLADDMEPSLFWGKQAVAMAEALGNQEILSHALNNVGTVLFNTPETRTRGKELLKQSLVIALQNSYHEHAARAYTNLGSAALRASDFGFALTVLDEGIAYCEERDLDSWSTYMLQCKAKVYLETGRWDEAVVIAGRLSNISPLASIVKMGAYTILAVIQIRRHGGNEVPALLQDATALAFKANELQRILPVMTALLEFEWLTGKTFIDDDNVSLTINLVQQGGLDFEISGFAYWLYKARGRLIEVIVQEAYNIQRVETALQAANFWRHAGCPYEQALMLFEGGDNGKRQALAIMQQLGADAVYKKLLQQMRNDGLKSIPRGKRKTTTGNPAMLTEREIDVLRHLKTGMQDKEIAGALFISPKTVGHHISSILFKLDVNSRIKAVQEAQKMGVI